MEKGLFSAIIVTVSLLCPLPSCGQNGRFVMLKYGDMENWVTRTIHESAVIGGEDKTLWEIGPTKHITGNTPYKNLGGSPWGTSNVMAKVSGIVKTNNSVSRDRHGGGYCAKMETHIEKVKVLGIVNIKVLAAGSIFIGDMHEPITGTKNGQKYMNWGMPFTARPKALRYDYKFKAAAGENRIKQTGFGGSSVVPGRDKAITVLFLQKRKEDAKGNITATRVGTLVVTYGKSTSGWVEKATYKIHYGDIRNSPDYDEATMGLRSTDYARNSKGENVLVTEVGWANSNESPTHMVLQFSSSHGGAYVGSPGNTFWVDNVGLVY